MQKQKLHIAYIVYIKLLELTFLIFVLDKTLKGIQVVYVSITECFFFVHRSLEQTFRAIFFVVQQTIILQKLK